MNKIIFAQILLVFNKIYKSLHKKWNIFLSRVILLSRRGDLSMVLNQDTLIYIEDNDKIEASIAAKGFADKETQNRAYINTLGAELALKYLNSENIDIQNIYNIHSIKKILEENDISDIMLPNIHIDVRVVFDENFIFIPKEHFQYNLTPDIYIVFKLAEDLSHVNFLGFFEPKLINKNNSNDKYYFIEKEKLNSPLDLKKFIENFKGSTEQKLSEDDIQNSERIMISIIDNDVTDEEKKYLLKQLTKCAELRDRFIEYENFEVLSYRAIADDEVIKKEYTDKSATTEDIVPIAGFDENSKTEEENANSTDNLNLNTDTNLDDFLTSDLEDVPDINEINAIEASPELETPAPADITDTLEELPAESQAEVTNTNIEASTKEEVQDNTSQKTDSSSVIGDVAALGTAAALGAGTAAAAMAAGELINEVSEGIDLVKEGINLAEAGLESYTTPIDNNPQEKTISFDDIKIDDKNTDSIEENSSGTENSISFEDIQIDDNIENNTLSDTKDENSISFDDIEFETPENDLAEETTNSFDPGISLDNIDISESNIEPLDTNLPDLGTESISFDNIDTSSIAVPQIDENMLPNESISFDNIELNDNNVAEFDEEDDNTNTLDFDSIEDDVQAEELTDDNIAPAETDDNNIAEFAELDSTENSNIDNNLTSNEDSNISDFLDSSMDFNENDQETADLLNSETNANETADISEMPDENSSTAALEPQIFENEPEETTEKSEGFGKNLLEGLSEDNVGDISIEDLGITDADNSTANAQDISSNDLFAEIDDLLSDTEQSGSNIQASETQPTEQQNDISDFQIEDLLGSDSIDDIVNQKAAQAQNTASSTNDNSALPTDDIASLIDQVETNYIPDDTAQQADGDDTNDKLGFLFNDNENNSEGNLESLAEIDSLPDTNTDDMPTPPGVALYNKKSSSGSSKKIIIVAAAVVAVLASASVFAFLKSKGTDSNIDSMAQNTNESEILDTAKTASTAPLPANTANETSDENVLTNAPDINSIDKKEVQKAKTSKDIKNIAKTQKPKQVNSDSYISVQKLVWDVPDYLSYSNKMKNYLMTAGKSIKLSLSADLLLATEYAYSNQVKVGLTLSNNGSVQNAKIINSSGSKEIDDIVLQSVKNTLDVVKPPAGEVKGSNFNLGLIIYL